MKTYDPYLYNEITAKLAKFIILKKLIFQIGTYEWTA